MQTSFKQKIGLIIFGFFMFLILLELSLQIAGGILRFAQRYHNNSSLRQKSSCRILCLGESMTALGGRNSYPFLLGEILNRKNTGINFVVINEGVPGVDSSSIVSGLEKKLDKYKPDIVIAMMGINDDREDIATLNKAPRRGTGFCYGSIKLYKLFKLLRLQVSAKLQTLKAKEFKSAHSSKSQNYVYYIELAIQHREKGDYKKAVELFNEAIKIKPDNHIGYLELGLCYRMMGNCKTSEEIFKEALNITPNHMWGYLQLGWTYRAGGDYLKAEQIYKKAIGMSPLYYRTYLELGWMYLTQKQYDKAEELYKNAMSVLPEDDRIYGALAFCYQIQNKGDLAREYSEKAGILRSEYINPITQKNYKYLNKTILQKGLRLVCVQYPMRSIRNLKKMLKPCEGVTFVDNEHIFKEALQNAIYSKYFTDTCGGDFGHCTKEGNRLLAENIATVIINEIFYK